MALLNFGTSRAAERTKRSVDLSNDVDAALDAYRGVQERRGKPLSRGAAIETILGPILSLSPAQASQLGAAAEKELKSTQALLDVTQREDAFSHHDLQREAEVWKTVHDLFETLAVDSTPRKPMRSIQMRGKRVIIPDSPDWVVINEVNAASSTRATIIEVKNGARFNVPYFVYFDNEETSTRLMDKAILAIFPDFERVLKEQVEPVMDANGVCLNLGEVQRAPATGYFPACEHDPILGDPYGVHIIPDEKGKQD